MHLESSSIIAVNSHEKVLQVFHDGLIFKTYSSMLEKFDALHLQHGQLLEWDFDPVQNKGCLLMTGPVEAVEALQKAILGGLIPGLKSSENFLSLVGVTCRSATSPETLDLCLKQLEKAEVSPLKVLFSATGLGFVVEQKNRVSAIRCLHGMLEVTI